MAQGTTRGVPIDIDPLLAADSDLLVPSQKAVKAYIDNGLVNKQDASTRRNANNSANNSINYCGVALGTGVSESATVWTITRLTISTSGSITTAIAINVAWTNRESATYI
jgi:hypothetical protein